MVGEHEWYVIEAELLSHGVWPHIAEQIARFVVATQNPSYCMSARRIEPFVVKRSVAKDVSIDR